MIVRVPASSANLGPGFDTLGMALSMHAEAGVIDGEVPISRGLGSSVTVRLGLLHDLRTGGRLPVFEKRSAPTRPVPEERRREVLDTIRKALTEVV